MKNTDLATQDEDAEKLKLLYVSNLHLVSDLYREDKNDAEIGERREVH